MVTFSNLLAEDYVIREESVPERYEIMQTFTATMGINGANVNLGNIQNDYIEVWLNKVTKGTEDLITAPAEFRLYTGTRPNGTELYDTVLQTGNNYFWNGTSLDETAGTAGRILVEALADGDYYFEEISAPEKYDLPTGGDEVTEFIVGDSNQILIVENTLSESTLTLTKTDGSQSITSNPAGFRMYNILNEPIMFIGSDGNYTYDGVGDVSDTATLLETSVAGIIIIDRLIYDDYYFIETSSPYGYQDDSATPYDITIDADVESLTVINDALPTYDVVLTKTDGTNAITGNEAGFCFYTSENEPVLVTGSDGSYSFSRIGIGAETAVELFTSTDGSLNIADVPMGDYYFLETHAPVDYELNSTAKQYISVDGIDDSINVSNTLAAIYSLGDYVWIDADKDGVQDVGEIPVDNVTVTLYDENNNQIGDPAVTGFDTWNSGYYEFTNLTAGRYYVVFSNLPDDYIFTNTDSGTDDTDDSDANTTTGKTQTVLVDNSTTVDNHYPHLDAGIHLDIPEIYSLGDYVWIDEDEDGVQDSDETFVNDVTVTLYNSSGIQIGSSVLTGSGTWDDGYYEFAGLPKGEYYVVFSNIPSGYSFTQQNSGSDETKDSDADSNTGRTIIISLNSESTDINGHFPDLDAGIYFNPELANVHIHANKLVNDIVPTECEEFGFTLTKVDINGNVITGQDAYSQTVFNVKGDIDFNLQYDMSDAGNTYYYKIVEEESTLFGYIIDSSVIDIETSVYLDDIIVKAEVVQSLEGITLISDHTFRNEFAKLTQEEIEEEGVDPIFTVQKTVDGQSVLQGEIFSFKVQQVDENGNPVAGGFNEVVSNDAAGYAEFSQILYYAEDIGKTYYYNVTEVEGTGDYIYDTSKYTATIEITNDDPQTPAVVTVVMRDESGVELSRTVIVDQGLEVRVPSISFNNDSISDIDNVGDISDVDGAASYTSDVNDEEIADDDDSTDLPDTATNNYLWLTVAAIIIAIASVGFAGVIFRYKKHMK